jgi:hypothetical protein
VEIVQYSSEANGRENACFDREIVKEMKRIGREKEETMDLQTGTKSSPKDKTKKITTVHHTNFDHPLFGSQAFDFVQETQWHNYTRI